MITVKYDESFLPWLTLFHSVEATPTVSALQTVISDSNYNMFLRVLILSWTQWEKATIKLLIQPQRDKGLDPL